MAFDSAQLRADFLADNLARSALSDGTRAEVERAIPSAELVELDDGTPVLRSGGTLLGADFDPESLHAVVQRAGRPVTFVVFGMGTGHTVRGLRMFTNAPLI